MTGNILHPLEVDKNEEMLFLILLYLHKLKVNLETYIYTTLAFSSINYHSRRFKLRLYFVHVF